MMNPTFLYGRPKLPDRVCAPRRAATAPNDPHTDDVLLRRSIRAAATVSLTEDEFVRRVRASGTKLEAHFDHSGVGGLDTVGGIIGYTARWRDHGLLKQPVTDKALAADTRLSELRCGWRTGPEAQMMALAQWSHPGGSPVATRDTIRLTEPRLWVRGLNDAFDFQAGLLEFRPHEAAAWAWAGARLAGLTALWAQRFESGAGPITAASEVLAILTWRPRARQRPTHPGSACDLGRAAYVLGHLGSTDTMREWLLYGQIIASIRAVTRACRDRGELKTASALQHTVVRPLIHVRNAFQTESGLSEALDDGPRP